MTFPVTSQNSCLVPSTLKFRYLLENDDDTLENADDGEQLALQSPPPIENEITSCSTSSHQTMLEAIASKWGSYGFEKELDELIQQLEAGGTTSDYENEEMCSSDSVELEFRSSPWEDQNTENIKEK